MLSNVNPLWKPSFSNTVKNLNTDSDLSDITSQINNGDPVFRSIEKHANHPSILKIKKKISDKGLNFSFKYVTRNKIAKEIQNLGSKKACLESDIPVNLIKNNVVVISPFIDNNFNNSLFSSCFPSELKNANVTPVFKKKDQLDVENYGSVSILPIFSKVYERCMYDQKCMNTLTKFLKTTMWISPRF